MLAQKGHSLGPAPGLRIQRFTWCTSRKTAKATMTKRDERVQEQAVRMTGAPAAVAAARVG